VGCAEFFTAQRSPQAGYRRFLGFGRVANLQRKPKDQAMTEERQALFELIEKRADAACAN
jgi:hypothetical protein